MTLDEAEVRFREDKTRRNAVVWLSEAIEYCADGMIDIEEVVDVLDAVKSDLLK